ncbi:hypothetical protein NHX12_009268 [Muraenolepis orangiensis]|uniref:Multidrug and toxin extrusion protein n=1 Tax=Muraenolepis orangiensis TaxID=630683 RepID=A0A9Q0DN66_9TELE|nr:hypothetical protein NHX12_009268 [Muraenolepis orangiensis]
MAESSARMFCCSWLRNRIPLAYREEIYHLLSLTGPLLLSRLLTYLLPFVVTMFSGRQGNQVMAGYGLACSTFGGKNLHRVGVILQRSILILLLFCLPCWGLLINTQTILLATGQLPEGIIMPQVYMAVLANVANILTNYVLVIWLDLGLKYEVLLIPVCFCWTAESLQEWGSYMRLAIPSTMMTCFEWWIYESGGILAGLLGENELAAQHAVMVVACMIYMVPLGIQAAACVRVGNALGAGDTAGAILSSKVSLSLAGGFAVVECLVLASSKSAIGLMFTSHEEIVALVSHLMGVYCVVPLCDSLVCVCSGILLGSGRQKIAAVANLIGYYGIGLPLAVTLMFVAKLRGLGFWIGLLTAAFIQASFYIVVIFNFNWETMTAEAVKRGKKNMQDHLNPETSYQSGNNNSSCSVKAHISQCEEMLDQAHLVQLSELVQGPRKRLSTHQLVLRRGFTAVTMVLLLAAGVSVYYMVPLPETAIIPSQGNLTTGWTNSTDATPDPVLSTTWVSHV